MKKLWTLRRIVGVPVSLAVVMTASSVGLPHLSLAQDRPATAAQTEKVNRLIDEVVTADVELEVTKRRSKILRLKQDVFRVAVADPSLIDFVGFGSREVEIIGKEAGSTTVTFWVGKEENAQLLSVLVTVVRDDGIEDQGRKDFADLNSLINEMFPNSRVQLIPIADKVIIRGQARDEQEAVQIMSLIRKNADMLPSGTGGYGGGTATGAAVEPFPDTRQNSVARNLVNMLKIPGEKQVLLKVRIAELTRSASRELGADFNFDVKSFGLTSTLGGSGGNITASANDFNVKLKAMVKNGSAKVLAEPNLVALSGHSATFLAGGEFAVPTVVGVGGAQAATTSFKGHGTSINFLPTVLDKDRIRLEVTPTFSSINKENSVNGVFGLDTRSVSTVVDLREGQVFAIAGLLLDLQSAKSVRLPYIGDWKFFNLLTDSRSVSRGETELIVLVTPELVHALEPNQVPTILPGMEVTEPTDHDFFFHGNIEGRPNCHHRSTVWPLYKKRMKQAGYSECQAVQKSEEFYLHGEHGFSSE